MGHAKEEEADWMTPDLSEKEEVEYLSFTDSPMVKVTVLFEVL
jgi:hypothetical protein